jgi:AcrR family transcriptional regulator
MRGRRTRIHIVDATIDLIQGGNPHPTSRQIAVHAEVSVRVIFYHFDDVGMVLKSAAARQFLRHRPFIAALPAVGPVDTRIRATCHQRRQLYEAIAPMFTMAHTEATVSDGVGAVLAETRAQLCQQVMVTLRPEISARGAGAQPLLDSLVLASGWPNWDMLRSHMGYSATAAEHLMVRSFTDLLR